MEYGHPIPPEQQRNLKPSVLYTPHPPHTFLSFTFFYLSVIIFHHKWINLAPLSVQIITILLSCMCLFYLFVCSFVRHCVLLSYLSFCAFIAIFVHLNYFTCLCLVPCLQLMFCLCVFPFVLSFCVCVYIIIFLFVFQNVLVSYPCHGQLYRGIHSFFVTAPKRYRLY